MKSRIDKVKLYYQILSATLFAVWLFVPPCRHAAFATWKFLTLLLMLTLAIYLLWLAHKRSQLAKIEEEINKLKRR